MDSSDSYKTISSYGSSELIVERSRFIAQAKRVSSKEEALGFIEEVKNANRDATHNVPVFVIGKSQEEKWSSEDGEPQGTSGAPVLKMLVSEGITDICIVTTRYFGGVKLGPGGLIRAYTEVAKAALSDAGIVRVEKRGAIIFETDYKTFNKIKSHKFSHASIDSEEFSERIRFRFVTAKAERDRMVKEINEIANGALSTISEEETETETREE